MKIVIDRDEITDLIVDRLTQKGVIPPGPLDIKAEWLLRPEIGSCKEAVLLSMEWEVAP